MGRERERMFYLDLLLTEQSTRLRDVEYMMMQEDVSTIR